MIEAARQRTVCVLGFSRSGTSLTMQVLNALGVDLGADEDMLRPHEADNPRGYWEPRWLVELNDEILAALGTTWWKPFPGEPGWPDSPQLASLRERAQAVFAEKLGGAELSGWKDPRTSLTLPFWQPIVPDPLYVICVRSPIDAIASIQRRPEPTLSTHEWGELWLESTARALRDTAGKRRLLVFYGDYFRDARAQVARLAALLDMAPTDERIDEAATLIESDLRHHRTSPVEVAAAFGISPVARLAFLALQLAQELRNVSSADPESAQICDAIERVAIDAWQGSRETTATRTTARQLEQQLETVREREQQLAEEIETLRAGGQQLEADLAHAHDEMDRRYRDLSALQASRSWRLTAPLRALKQRPGSRPRG